MPQEFNTAAEKSYQVIIIGAGPAGLAAGTALSKTQLKFCILDIGQPLDARQHGANADLGHGTGGAGLYSDGKFSFFPSATELWSLKPREDLESAYEWIISELRTIGLSLSDVPLVLPVAPSNSKPHKSLLEKKYPSAYGTFDQRKAFISKLAAPINGRIQANSTVSEIAEHRHGYTLNVIRDAAIKQQYNTKSVLLASGRLGPLLVQRTPFIEKRFRRFEIGVRIQQPTKKFFLAAHPQVDPKFIFSDCDSNVEYRTFCCCRNGEIIALKHEGILALSGRSDGNTTQYSNVGFLMRITDETIAKALFSGQIERIRNSTPTQMELSDFLNATNPEDTPIGANLGQQLTKILVRGLKRLTDHFGDSALSDATLHYPAVEGVGDYPETDSSLRVPGTRIWAAGDVNGHFRGLVAALISGYFSGLQIRREMEIAQ